VVFIGAIREDARAFTMRSQLFDTERIETIPLESLGDPPSEKYEKC
jgi:hypothetical protein